MARTLRVGIAIRCDSDIWQNYIINHETFFLDVILARAWTVDVILIKPPDNGRDLKTSF